MRNHYVPQFLQQPWAAASDCKLQVFRLGERGVESFRQTPKGNGYVEDMLSLTREQVAGMDQHAIEKVVLQTVDNDASLVKQKLDVQGLSALTLEERTAWVRLIMSLRLRQPDIVTQLRSESASTLRETLAAQPEEYDAIAVGDAPPTLEEWTESRFPGLIENFGLSFFHELLDNKTVGDKLLQLRWWLYDFSACSHRLLLADNPCIFAGGIDDPNLVVVLPISPTKAFIATRGELTAKALREARPSVLLRQLNDATVRQASTYIYGHDESQLRFIENRRLSLARG